MVIKCVLDRYDWIWNGNENVNWRLFSVHVYVYDERGNKMMQYTVLILAWHPISNLQHKIKDFKNRFIIILLVVAEKCLLYEWKMTVFRYHVHMNIMWKRRHTRTNRKRRNPISWFSCQYFCFAKYRFVLEKVCCNT